MGPGMMTLPPVLDHLVAGRPFLRCPVRGLLLSAWLCLIAGVAASAADFLVTTPNDAFNYTINGVGQNPTLTLVRGQTYSFEIDTCICHPFEIVNAPQGSVVNNDISSGTLTFTVPLTAVNWTYRCSIHNFQGTIQTVAAAAPSATTVAASNIGAFTAKLNASVHPNGSATDVAFIYGTDSNLSAGTTTTAVQAIGSGSMTVNVDATVSGLLPSTEYHFRVQATNGAGTSLGSILSFTTQSDAPEIAVFNGASTAPGNARTDGVGVFAMPTTPVGNTSAAQTFTIQNIGGSDLTGLAVTKAAQGNPDEITVDTTAMPAMLAPGAATSFTVTFSPTAEGTRNAVIEIASNDADENPFEIALAGRTHAVGFQAATQSQIEDAVTITIPVQITAAAGVSFSVPVGFGGTAIDGTDYTHSSSAVNFSADQTVANVTLTLKEDTLTEGDETVVLSLGAPSVSSVTRGAATTFTLTIGEDDAPPAIDPQPQSQIVAVGAAAQFNSGATGSPPISLQWKKNGLAILGATQSNFPIPVAVLGDAGAYTLTAKNARATKTSATAQLAVVDQTPGIVRANAGATASINVTAKGNTLTFRWRKGGVPLDNNAKYSGVSTNKLTVKAVAVGDAGIYSCLVTSPGGSLSGGDQELQVPTQVPAPLQPAFPDAVAHNAYGYQIPFDPDPSKAPTRFVCAGLPSGLTCNVTTGFVSGKATSTGAFNITLTLSNGVGPAGVVQDAMSVLAFPSGAVGSFVGYVTAHAGLNAELGGRVDLTTTAKGSFTGTLKLGGASHPLTGAMVTEPTIGAHPQAALTIKRTGKPALLVALDIDPAGNALTGTVTLPGGVTTAAIVGWRNIWRTTTPANPVVNGLGLHAFEFERDKTSAGLTTVPQGYGFATIAVTAAGKTTVSGRLADGGTLTVSGLLGPDGEVLVFQMLNSNQASLFGALHIASDADHTIGGALVWKKNAQGNARDYPPFGPIAMNIGGGVYSVTKPILGLPATLVGVANAQLRFTEGGIADSQTNPDVQLRISDKNVATLPPAGPQNPGKITSLTLNTATGAFSGRFTLTDVGMAPRTVPFQGQLVPTRAKGYGFFLLPASGVATSPIRSGRVILDAIEQ